MTTCAIIFKDTKKGEVEVGLDVEDIENQKEMTPAIYTATLLSFIIERGYEKQFEKEFLEEYEKMIEEKEG